MQLFFITVDLQLLQDVEPYAILLTKLPGEVAVLSAPETYPGLAGVVQLESLGEEDVEVHVADGGILTPRPPSDTAGANLGKKGGMAASELVPAELKAEAADRHEVAKLLAVGDEGRVGLGAAPKLDLAGASLGRAEGRVVSLQSGAKCLVVSEACAEEVGVELGCDVDAVAVGDGVVDPVERGILVAKDHGHFCCSGHVFGGARLDHHCTFLRNLWDGNSRIEVPLAFLVVSGDVALGCIAVSVDEMKLAHVLQVSFFREATHSAHLTNGVVRSGLSPVPKKHTLNEVGDVEAGERDVVGSQRTEADGTSLVGGERHQFVVLVTKHCDPGCVGLEEVEELPTVSSEGATRLLPIRGKPHGIAVGTFRRTTNCQVEFRLVVLLGGDTNVSGIDSVGSPTTGNEGGGVSGDVVKGMDNEGRLTLGIASLDDGGVVVRDEGIIAHIECRFIKRAALLKSPVNRSKARIAFIDSAVSLTRSRHAALVCPGLAAQ